MPLKEDFQLFVDALLPATQLIAPKYFRLPIVNEGFQIRERVFCYEIYHQLRIQLTDGFPYTLGGEVDKNGHPIIYNHCRGIKPDFLVHNPGNMGPEDNLAIMEVKPIQLAGLSGDIGNDIEKINCMTNIPNGYYKGIILVFGEGYDGVKEQIHQYFHEHCNPDRVLLLFHHHAGQPAEVVNYA